MSNENVTGSTKWMSRILIVLFIFMLGLGGLSFFVGGGSSDNASSSNNSYNSGSSSSQSRDSNPF
jgi:hypothetical protein